MLSSLTRSSLTVIWVMALAIALWLAAGTASIIAWCAFAIIGVTPPMVLLMRAPRPAPLTARAMANPGAGL